MSNFRLVISVALTVFVLNASFPAMGAAAESVKSMFVANTPDNPVPVVGVGTQAVAGAVSVTNLPLSDGRLQVRDDTPRIREVRHGHGTISLESAFPRQLDLPSDVVLTDAILTRANFATSDPTCAIWLFEVRNGSFGPIHQLHPSDTNPVAEIHFESGIAPTATSFGFFMNSDCRVNVLWSGYTLP